MAITAKRNRITQIGTVSFADGPIDPAVHHDGDYGAGHNVYDDTHDDRDENPATKRDCRSKNAR